MTKRLTIFVLLAVAVMLCAPSVFAQRAQRMTWKIDDVYRSGLVYMPSAKSASGKTPLVFSFHGRGDNAENFQYVDIQREWPEAIVVYLQGAPSRRDGYPAWQFEKGQDDDRDLRLVDAALVTLRSKFNVDDNRIYATGLSNGAIFTYLLWTERPKLFAAFAPVAGRLRPSVQPKEPKPLFHIAGKQDTVIPFAGQLDAIETAKRVNGITGNGESCGEGCTLYGSSSGAPVMTWIHPGGHIYPDSSSARIAKFFRDHPMRK